MAKHKVILSREDIELAIKNSDTMQKASTFFRCTYRTFVKNAKMYGLYKPSVVKFKIKINLEDILNGLHPSYPTSHLSKRLIKEGIKQYKCEKCGISSYNDEHISLELDHLDGNKQNHLLNNLRLLCPNCHSQTPTYRSKKLVLNRS